MAMIRGQDPVLAGLGPGRVLTERHIADPVDPVLDRLLPPNIGRQMLRCGLPRAETGDPSTSASQPPQQTVWYCTKTRVQVTVLCGRCGSSLGCDRAGLTLVEEFSNHPAVVVCETEMAIKDQHRRITEHARAVVDLQAQHAASRHRWQLGKRLTQYQEVRELRGRAPVVDPQAEHRLAQQAAGVAAEDQMTVALQRLSDDWLLFRGYVNRRGEVDHLVVGPGGIWAIEVKGRGVCVHIDGDQWRYEKFDRYGNLVDQGILADRRGRSWGRQVWARSKTPP